MAYSSSRFRSALISVVLIGGAIAGCGSSPVPSEAPSVSQDAAGGQATESAPMPLENQMVADRTPAGGEISPSVDVTRSQPQLARTAELGLTVDSVPAMLEQVKTITRQQRGDVLNLQDNTPQESDRYHTASIQLQVPQANLDATLKQLAELGTVQRQAIAAEDVSNQLVDTEARLRNLRRTEEMLLEIMTRSGSVGDVLKVAQELSNVRNSIEQIDAQLKQLQSRVAYSTVNVNLQAAVAGNVPGRSTSDELTEAWSGATRSLGEFTVGLMQLGIWLMVYSPYWLVLGGAAILYSRHRRNASRGEHLPSPGNQS